MLHNPTIAEQHEHWMANYGRTYNDPQEKAMRQAIFAKNLQFIEDFNKSGNRTFKLGLNQFSDLTNEEFVRSHTGCLAPRRPEPAIPTSVSHQKLTADVLDHIDWVEKGVKEADLKTASNSLPDHTDKVNAVFSSEDSQSRNVEVHTADIHQRLVKAEYYLGNEVPPLATEKEGQMT
ncbi:senescence-specific cysteine protease SAG39-like [Eucalyptus grandis]|uniref:senescence-specific cysteine protease SAG39-like n=1 Tax=Eucalyptus grandis TaxID=71139 RepID=UPI00192EAA4F|nr:senescence-specific cysteine protease SAG39-like [Eucalyptus grandis]